MKQKDFAIIGIVIFVSFVISIYVSNALFSTPSNQAQEVSQVSAVTPGFVKPSTVFFNNNSIDPSQNIGVGLNTNQSPFSATTN